MSECVVMKGEYEGRGSRTFVSTTANWLPTSPDTSATEFFGGPWQSKVLARVSILEMAENDSGDSIESALIA